MTETIIWHNPRCSKSRQTLALLHEKGVDPVIRLYLEDVPVFDEIRQALDMLAMDDPRQLMRMGEALYKEKKAVEKSGDALITLMAENPKLIERPLVIHKGRAVLGRPPENINQLFD